MKKNQAPNSKKKQFDNYLKFSFIGFQMVAIVLVGVGLGYLIDEKMNNEKPYASLISTLVFVFISMYSVIKALKSIKQDND